MKQYSCLTLHPFILILTMAFQNAVADGKNTIADIMKSYADPSYVTFGGGIDKSDNIEFDDIFYEAQVGVDLSWKSHGLKSAYHAEKLPKSDIWGIYIPITFSVRQFTSDSSPVKTPSYNPGIRLVYADQNWVKSNEKFKYWSLGFHHYSNGQSGSHLLPGTNEVNTENGSFSSDYVEFAFHILDREQIFHFLRLKYRNYLTNLTWEEDQTDFFEEAVAEVTAQFNFQRALEGTSLSWLIESTISAELFLTAGYKLGKKYDINGDRVSSSDKFQLKVEYIAKPENSNDLAWYLRWDYGNDYYNINYRNDMNRLQFGVIGKIF